MRLYQRLNKLLAAQNAKSNPEVIPTTQPNKKTGSEKSTSIESSDHSSPERDVTHESLNRRKLKGKRGGGTSPKK